MNKHFLKKIRDNIPEPVKYITAPVFRNKLIRHKGFREYYRLLQNSDNTGEEEIYAFQLRQLQSLLQYAYTNVPYYKILFDKIDFNPAKVTALTDIERIPFLTKQIIRENFEALTSRSKIPGGYYVATTGGSTGEPLRILLDYDSIFVENAFLYHFRSKLGYTFDDKVATFRGIEFGDKLWKYNPMQNELVFSPFRLSKLTIKTYAERVKKYNPQYFLGYLSCIYLFAKLLQESNIDLKLNLKGIFLISENIDLEQRSFLEDFFATKTSTFYGHSERCVIAEEMEKGMYKPCPFYGYTELIGQEGGY
jgi:phenylacetate-CoA ligase